MAALDVQQREYGQWPLSIADEFGPADVSDAIDYIASLEREKAGIDSSDGDAMDAIWRAQNNLVRLLSHAVLRCLPQLVCGLEHPDHAVRFWLASVAMTAPNRQFVPALRRALALEQHQAFHDHYQRAIQACEAMK